MSFASYSTAALMRDTMESVSREVLQRERPQYRYATVQSVDTTKRRAMVTFSGEPLSVPVRYGAMRPAGAGALVRVDGLTGDRHVADVTSGKVAFDDTIVLEFASGTSWALEFRDGNYLSHHDGMLAAYTRGSEGSSGFKVRGSTGAGYNDLLVVNTNGVVNVPNVLVVNTGAGGGQTNAHLRFGDDSGLGFYAISNNELRLTTEGLLRMSVNAQGVTLHNNGTYHTPYGSQSAPAYSFVSNTNTGLYGASNFVATTVNGSFKLVVYNNRVRIVDGIEINATSSDAIVYTHSGWTGVTFQNFTGHSFNTPRRGNILDVRDEIGGSNYSSLRLLQTVATATTGSAANVHLTSAANLNYVTSSAEVKLDVEDLSPDWYRRAMNLKPVWHRSKAGADRPDWSFYGLIAEEVAAELPQLAMYKHKDGPEAYEEAVESGEPYDPDDLLPVGVAYDRVAVLALALVQEIEKRTRALEQRAGLAPPTIPTPRQLPAHWPKRQPARQEN